MTHEIVTSVTLPVFLYSLSQKFKLSVNAMTALSQQVKKNQS